MVEISCKYGYYDIFIDGKFYCSCDNIKEAEGEIEAYEKENNVE